MHALKACLEPAWGLKQVITTKTPGMAVAWPLWKRTRAPTESRHAGPPISRKTYVGGPQGRSAIKATVRTTWAPVSEMPVSEEKTMLEGLISCSVIKSPEGEGSDLPTSKENMSPYSKPPNVSYQPAGLPNTGRDHRHPQLSQTVAPGQ